MADNSKIGGIWPPVEFNVPATPQMSFVFFLDGFDHYTDLTQKWTNVTGGTIVGEAGTWYDLASTHAYHEYSTDRKRGNALKFAGSYMPGDTLPYIEKDVKQLAEIRTHLSFNMKADVFSGTPFLQFYDESYNLLAGFAFTPEGLLYTMYGALYSNILFANGAYIAAPGHWINLKCGIGFAINSSESVDGALGLRVAMDEHNTLTGFGNFYNVDPAGMSVKYVRLAPAGENTVFSDLICTGGKQMINEYNNIHTLKPLAEEGIWPSGLVGDDGAGPVTIHVSGGGDAERLDDYPPDTGSSISFTSSCQSKCFAYIVAPYTYYRSPYSNQPLYIRGPGADSGVPNADYWMHVLDPATLGAVGVPAAGRDINIQPLMFGLDWQSFGTVQVNALTNGTHAGLGCIAPPQYVYPIGFPGPGYTTRTTIYRDHVPDGDSNYIWHDERSEWQFDISQVCHWHRWIRRLWQVNTFNNVWLGVMAMRIFEG